MWTCAYEIISVLFPMLLQRKLSPAIDIFSLLGYSQLNMLSPFDQAVDKINLSSF